MLEGGLRRPPPCGGEQVRTGDDNFLLERHAQDSLVGLDSYFPLPIGREIDANLQRIFRETQRDEEPYLFGVEETLGEPDGDGGDCPLGKLLRQLLRDQGNLVGDFELADKVLFQGFQLLREFQELLLFPFVLLGILSQLPSPIRVFRD
ncbi:MAG TPA: hypothetical protein VFF01_09845 [Candidatus Deferrimicrobiaceae bacterium]|nr:hypothetical protein [Candidatus Deferrimicrobiaceae bacterium]